MKKVYRSTKLVILAVLLSFSVIGKAQDSTSVHSFGKSVFAIGNTGTYSFYAVNTIRPAIGEHSAPFKAINDLRSWKGMDKHFHGYFSYALTGVQFQALKSVGVEDHKAGIYSLGIASLYALTKELSDAHVDVGGFSPYDLAVGFLGSAAYLVQEKKFGEQKLQVKYGFYPSPYRAIPGGVLGGPLSQFMRDYNAMSFWYSLPLSLFNSNEKQWQEIIGVAYGYGANGMYGAYNNNFAAEIYDRSSAERYAQHYIGLDIRFRAIPTNKKILKGLFYLMDFVRLPLPSLEYSQGSLKVNPITKY